MTSGNNHVSGELGGQTGRWGGADTLLSVGIGGNKQGEQGGWGGGQAETRMSVGVGRTMEEGREGGRGRNAPRRTTRATTGLRAAPGARAEAGNCRKTF